MPAVPPPPGPVRPSAVVNEEIRELAGRVVLSKGERDRLVEGGAEGQAAGAREAEIAA